MSVKLAFIGAGSTIFMKNIVGDMLHFEALRDARISLMDIDANRLAESRMVAETMIIAMGASGASVEATTDRARALDGADFVITAFQIGGYRPSTEIDFAIPKRYGLRQTIADTLGVGGIMRGLRTIPHLWDIAADMMRLCPDAFLLQYVNPMAMNTWALAERFPRLKQMGLCHSVQNTIAEIAHDLDIPGHEIHSHVAGINHVAFFLVLEHEGRDLYPLLRAGYHSGRLPRPPLLMPRCWNNVRYEVMDHLGYFCTESSEHLAEYVPWFIKDGRDDLIEAFKIPLDEYPRRCIEQAEDWAEQARAITAANNTAANNAPNNAAEITVEKSPEHAAEIMNAAATDTPGFFHVNLPNQGQIPQLPMGAVVETLGRIDGAGIQPSVVEDIPPQLVALMRTQINVQELVVRAMLNQDITHIYHAAYMDPHTAAELDLRQIRSLVSDLLAAHGDWLPEWARPRNVA